MPESFGRFQIDFGVDRGPKSGLPLLTHVVSVGRSTLRVARDTDEVTLLEGELVLVMPHLGWAREREIPEPLIDKTESRRIRVEIRHVPLNVWDPIGVIGVKDEPNAQDEYDGYIGRLYELLVSKAPESELVDYLYWAVHDNMGLGTASRAHMVGTAEALRLIPLRPTQ